MSTILYKDRIKQSALDYQNFAQLISTLAFFSKHRWRVSCPASEVVPRCYCPVEKQALSNCFATFRKAKLISISSVVLVHFLALCELWTSIARCQTIQTFINHGSVPQAQQFFYSKPAQFVQYWGNMIVLSGVSQYARSKILHHLSLLNILFECTKPYRWTVK